MRRVLIVGLLMVAAMLSAQERVLFVQNRTERTLYVLVPADQELESSSTFRQIPSGGLLPLPGGTSVSGLAHERGSLGVATFAFSQARTADLEGRSAQRVYLPVEERHLTVREDLESADFDEIVGRPQIDNVYLEWLPRTAALARARDRSPLATYVDLGEGRQSIPLADSLLWQRGGTDLEWIKGVAAERDLFIAMASYSPFSTESSVFLYLVDSEEAAPVGTLEFSPGRGNGFVFLWTPTELQPAVVGNLSASEFFLEAQLWRSEIGQRIGGDLLLLDAEVATANSAAGPWEEFVLGRVELERLFGE